MSIPAVSSKEEQYQAVKNWPNKVGKRELLTHLKGDTIFIFQAIQAKCYECSVGDDDHCTVTICPLHPYSQFNKEYKVPVVTMKDLSKVKKTTKKRK